ncbi:hypothetical protein CLV78_104160 [Aliiruegeria haliotis]|uniref:Uncharacterized protein n=1 Tax=Aliiruegeria haliotis TaxID=1280846 RepID=A0A2T0RR46_9RHOB|nr:hypothetical protein [Aliiruegeria haliotis]PRY23669.1 hypothetical protein CLV78_104160 [Aliiruegeria haliotis]
MTEQTLPESNAALAELMRAKLGAGGADTLESKLRRVPGLLPRSVKRDVRYLIQMQKLWDHPKLRRQIDYTRVERAQANLRAFLEKIDPKDRLMGRFIGILAPLMLNILLIFAAFVCWLVWTGRV